jgi:hypothetical protein
VVCAAAVAVVGVVAVAGCTSSADAGPRPSSPVSPTVVTTSPTATATASGLTDEAAVAVAKAYFAAFNEGLKTRNSTKFRALTTGACISCNKDAATLDSLAKRDVTVEGGRYVYHLVPDDPVGRKFGDVFVTFDLISKPAVERDADGHVVDRFDGTKPAEVTVDLRSAGDHWLVRGILK